MSENYYPVSQTNLRGILDRFKLEVSRSINCVQIGKIESYSASKNTASVSISQTRKYVNGEELEFPLLTDCPVFMLQGGGAFINMPISVGDHCVVLFNDRDIDNWYETGRAVSPGTTRAHSLSDGIVLVGIQPSTSPLAADSSILEIHGGAKRVKTTSSVGIAERMTTGKYSVKNNAADLKTQLDALIDALVTVIGTNCVNGAPLVGSPTFITTANNIKVQLGLLLEAGS